MGVGMFAPFTLGALEMKTNKYFASSTHLVKGDTNVHVLKYKLSQKFEDWE